MGEITLNPNDHPVGTKFLERGPAGLHTERMITAWFNANTMQLDHGVPSVWYRSETVKVVEVLT